MPMGGIGLYYVYLVQCRDQSLYCGYTTDLQQRIQTHNRGEGAKYTKSRLPVTLVYHEEFEEKSAALRRECAIKRLTRQDKLALIASSDIE